MNEEIEFEPKKNSLSSAVLIVPLDIIKMIEATETPNHSPTWTTMIPARTGYCRPRS
jgi:hypothetical protein